jgi:predicted transcriptional regulator YdeE
MAFRKINLLASLALVFAVDVAWAQSAAPRKESAMKPKVVEEAGFTVVGIEARTSNMKEMSPDGIIAKQWARFVQENLAARIPNKADSSVLAVYSDYASDKDGEYSFMIGARVTSAKDVPAGMVVKKVPAGRYAILTSNRGPVAKVVVEAWQQIWAVPKSSPGGDRAYRADYEVYDERAANPEDAQVDVHIGIK